MLSREACERRIYRLAYLLLGDADRAMKVIEAVLDAQPDLAGLDSAHMDRLTVLRCREIASEPRPIDHPLVTKRVALALAGLPTQPREAWVLSRVYRLPDREVARSMDCSVTATNRHRDQADKAMRERLGDKSGTGLQSLLRVSMSLDVPAVYRASREHARRRRRVFIVVGVVGAAAAVVGALFAIFGSAGA